MSRLHSIPVADAIGHAAQLFTAIKGAIGVVPNAYVGIGSNSPHALEAGLNLDAALKEGNLSNREIEAIKLVVSEVADCNYCLAAHTMIGKIHGLDAVTMKALRSAEASGDAKLDLLSSLVRALVETRGVVPANILESARNAGYTDAQIVDVVLAITSITFTNLFNRLNDTVLDFPPVD